MLSIMMQRKGRTRHAQFRVIVQDSRFHPTSGRVVAYVGNYDPHTKVAKLNGEKISKYLASGAQPSERVAKLLSKEGIKLPGWFTPAAAKKGIVRNAAKRRSTRPPEEKVMPPAEAEAPVVEASAEAAEPVESAEAPAPAKEPAAEEPAAEADLSTEASAEVEAPAEAEQPKTE